MSVPSDTHADSYSPRMARKTTRTLAGAALSLLTGMAALSTSFNSHAHIQQKNENDPAGQMHTDTDILSKDAGSTLNEIMNEGTPEEKSTDKKIATLYRSLECDLGRPDLRKHALAETDHTIGAEPSRAYDYRVDDTFRTQGTEPFVKTANAPLCIEIPLLKDHRLSSHFGYRTKPHKGRHNGVDVAVPTGTPLPAPAAGTVVYAGWSWGYGNTVMIDHGEGIVTLYAHLSKLAVQTGDEIKKGEIIAKTGNSGRSTGPHLHFEIMVKKGDQAYPVDPVKYASNAPEAPTTRMADSSPPPKLH